MEKKGEALPEAEDEPYNMTENFSEGDVEEVKEQEEKEQEEKEQEEKEQEQEEKEQEEKEQEETVRLHNILISRIRNKKYFFLSSIYNNMLNVINK